MDRNWVKILNTNSYMNRISIVWIKKGGSLTLDGSHLVVFI